MAKESQRYEPMTMNDYEPMDYVAPDKQLSPEVLPGAAYLAAVVAVGLATMLQVALCLIVYVLLIQ